MPSKTDNLDNFYVDLRHGLSVASFLERYQSAIRFIHATGLTNDFRLGKGKTKRLRDEVSPVARFVKQNAAPEDRIAFTLDNTFPDCCIIHEGGHLREIEVTIAQGRETFFVMTELNEAGTGRGYLGLSDDAPTKEFRSEMAKPRQGYFEEDVVQSIISAVALCARKKGTTGGDTLLIEAPLETLAPTQWNSHKLRFSEQVRDLSFTEIYLTGHSDNNDICLRIK